MKNVKIYKVYAKNVNISDRIKEATDNDVQQAYDDIIYFYMSNDYIDVPDNTSDYDFDSAMSDAVEEVLNKLKAKFERTGFLECGDYMLKKANYNDISVPNMCDYESLDLL